MYYSDNSMDNNTFAMDMDLADSRPNSSIPPMAARTTGLAFSGGGVRSAAFCSGVLRRILQKSVRLDYLSSVSGGGYTATAYLDWKVRNGGIDDPAWHKQFFAHMRRRINVCCNSSHPCQKLIEALILVMTIMMTVIITPVLIWAPYAYPLAFCVDYIFKDLLKAKDSCVQDPAEMYDFEICQQKAGSQAYWRTVMFATTGVSHVIFYMMSNRCCRLKGYLRILSAALGTVFYMTFGPWLVFEFISLLPLYVKILVIPVSLVVWCFFPGLRSKVFFIVFIYFYTAITYWRVFRLPLYTVPYNSVAFNNMMFASGIVIWASPYIRMLQQTFASTYVRWRLQRAFFHPSSIGCLGCRGMNMCELLRYSLPCRVDKAKDPIEKRPLTMADLTGVSPQLIHNITVNDWMLDRDSKSYDLLMFTPEGIERIDPKASTDEFKNKLMAYHFRTSETMAISAGAISKRMGLLQTNMGNITPVLALSGLSFGASIVSDQASYDQQNLCIRTIPLIASLIRFVPLVAFPAIWFAGGDGKYATFGVLSYCAFMILFAVIAIQRTGRKNPGYLERLTRWCIAHDEMVYFIRSVIRLINFGPNPPAVMELSDGGHFENLGLLPLLKKRLKKIVVVNGGQMEKDEDYANDILLALVLARDRLHCSFIGYNGRDVIEDIRECFARKRPGDQPRWYRFRVQYYEKESLYSEGMKVGEGEILVLAPRHPNKGMQTTEGMTWDEVGQDLESEVWGSGPELDANEVDRLNGCICECCHGDSLRGLSAALQGEFPAHTTFNLMFTQSTFTAYHREGYRACVEGGADEFLSEADEPVVKQPHGSQVTFIEVGSRISGDVSVQDI